MCSDVSVLRSAQKSEINTFLADIMKHMLPDRAFEQHYAQLLSVVGKVTSHVSDFATLVAIERFLPFVDLFQKESVKVDACKTVMEAFCRSRALLQKVIPLFSKL